MNYATSYVRKPPTCVYLVLRSREQWWVECEGKPFGPCATQEEAESSASKLMEMFGDPARRAEVWAPDKDGKMRLIWKG
jgi:hypothetical protein